MNKILAVATCVILTVNFMTVKASSPMSVEQMAEHCELSLTDFELFAGCIEAESNRQLPEEGQLTTYGRLMIGICIWNRVNSDMFPNDARSVLCQSGQFSTVSGGVACTQSTSYSRWAVVLAYDTVHTDPDCPQVLFFNCRGFFSGREPYPNPNGGETIGGNYFSL